MAEFKIDGVTVATYPTNIQYNLPVLATAQNGTPIYSAFYEAILTFPTMTTTNWNAIASKFTDSTSHYVQLPHPNTSADTVFYNITFEILGNERSFGLYVYNAQVKIKRMVVF